MMANLAGPAGVASDHSPTAFAVLPGPRDDSRSDLALWTDLHQPNPRAAFERVFRLADAGQVKCYERRPALPRLRVAEAVETVKDFPACLERAKAGSDSGAERVIDASRAWPQGSGVVKDVEWGQSRIAARAEMEGAGTVVLADTYYPGWEALVDGKPVRIYRANCAFRAIQVPAGDHRLEFRFTPVAFRLGLWAALLSWPLFLVAGLGFNAKTQRTQREFKA